jgi:DNA-binding MarR family transcriptional regulator/outer membrane protein TolC
VSLRIEQMCQTAAGGRLASRAIGRWAQSIGLGEAELQLLWCLWQEQSDGADQTAIARQLAFSPARVSTTVERLRADGLIAQQLTAGDRRRHRWQLTSTGQLRVRQMLAHVDSASGAQPPASGVSGRVAAAMVLLAVMIGLSGCSRAYYRKQADAEVNCIIDHKAEAVGALPADLSIKIDPRSRMFDPDDPDCPPMPPDDPISHQLMDCVDCKPGAPCWKHAPHTPYADNPRWEEFLPRNDRQQVVLDLPGAVEMARLQSTDYQQQLETLYLSCLDVTFERFRFDTQFYGGSSIFFDASSPNPDSSLLTVSPSTPGAGRMRFERLTTTGGELVVGLANSFVWQFAGPDDHASRTLLDFSLLQPLLRGGGRARVMERLTIAERALLANVRQMEQYRRAFYLGVVTGSGSSFGAGLNRRGGLFGGSGLSGFTGVGTGGFGQVGGIGNGGGGQNQGFTGGAGAQQAGGYIGLLQSAQVIRNQYANIASLGESVEQLQAAHDAGRLDRFQVDLARQALYNAQSQLLNSAAVYQTSLDNFKVLYGMPPDLNLVVSDPLLDHFNLLDTTLSALQNDVTSLLNTLREGAPVAQSAENEDAEPEAGELDLFHDESRVDLSAGQLADLAAQAADFITRSKTQLTTAQEDYHRLQEALPARKRELARLAKREDARELEITGDLLNVENLNDRTISLNHDLAELAARLERDWARIDALTGETALPPNELQKELTRAVTALSGELLELSLLQARARLDTITFETVDLTPEQGYCIASKHRRDWMNARASLVDSWRLITFNADDLQSDLDFVFSGDVGSGGGDPFNFRRTNGSLRVGLEFDAPVTRLAERNTYRESLIDYQQARRNYYRFRDNIHRGIRNTLRQMRVDQLNFELRREAVHTAITQVDLARLKLSEPARPVAAAAPGTPLAPGGQSQFGDTVARDLVNALIDLLNVQNDFLSVWVDHEVQRLQLDYDLGIMELSPDGQRIEHTEPLRAFVDDGMCLAPFELPAPCNEATVDLPTAPDENESDPLPSLDLLPEAEPNTNEVLPPPMRTQSQRLPLSRFSRRG